MVYIITRATKIIYLIVSDCKDTPDSPQFDKQCKLQFSDSFDILVYGEDLAYLYAISHGFDLVDDVESLSEEEGNKLFEQAEKEYLNHVDLKKQFVDNAAIFYYLQEMEKRLHLCMLMLTARSFIVMREKKTLS